MKLNIDSFVVQMLREMYGPGSTLEDDRRFWRQIHGPAGLWKLRRDAKNLEELCQRLSPEGSDREFMKHRSRWIGICLVLSTIEDLIRIIYQHLPHFFARFAAELFIEMLGRAELVLEEKAPQLLNVFGEIGDQTSGTVAHSTPSRGAATRAAW
jgi:hypothetical protein